jgi:hypothetical protein
MQLNRIIHIFRVFLFVTLYVTIVSLSRIVEVKIKEDPENISEINQQLKNLEIVSWITFALYSLFFFKEVYDHNPFVYEKNLLGNLVVIIFLILLSTNYMAAINILQTCNLEAVTDIVYRTYCIVFSIGIIEIVLHTNRI